MRDAKETTPMEVSIRQVRHAAADCFKSGANWVSFYREILGHKGVIDELFPRAEQRDQFEQTPEYGEIQHMLAKLRERNGQASQSDEPTRVITVRLPKSLHESLRFEAFHHKTSMNKLCISKLLQVIAGDLVPSDLERRDGESTGEAADEEALGDGVSRAAGANSLHSTDRLHDYCSDNLLTGGRPF